MLASFQVKAGDKTGRIQTAPFISNPESEALLIAYCFRISVCNVSATLNTDEMGPHFIKHLICLNCYPISKPMEIIAHWQLVLQMECKSVTSPAAGELSLFLSHLLVIFKCGGKKNVLFPTPLCLRVRKKHIFYHFHHFLAHAKDIR